LEIRQPCNWERGGPKKRRRNSGTCFGGEENPFWGEQGEKVGRRKLREGIKRGNPV